MAKCSKGHDNIEGSIFCSLCGERISGGQIRCPSCGVTMDSASSFCGKCGNPVAISGIEGMIWRRDPNDFATRISEKDMPGILKTGLFIEQGTKALLFINGALDRTLQPGRYDAGYFAKFIPDEFKSKSSTILLVDTADVEVDLKIADIYTKDPLKIDINCKVIVQVNNPSFFFDNVMKGRDHYLISELKSSLYDELQNAFNESVGKKSVSELNWDLSLKRQFEVFVEQHLGTTFQRTGLNLIQLRTLDYHFEGYDKIRNIKQDAYLQVSEDEANLQKRKRLFDVYDQNQLQDIAEETKEVQYREQRQKLWAEMRKLANSDKMNEIKSADDLEAFIHEIDKGGFLRDEEIKDLKNSFAQSEKKREFLLQRIGLEQDLEAERIRMVGQAENKLAELEVNEKIERRKLDEQIKAQKDKMTAEREIKVEDAKADATINDLKRDADQKDMDMGLAGLERVKKMKAAEKREEMDLEVTRLERLSNLGIEALISASDSEKAKILADLKQTEILKGMTEEQILAMGATQSEHLAKAFQEKFKGMSATEQEKLYREMMNQKDTSMKTMQEMFNKALETQRDATVGVAQGGRVTAVYPPPGQSGYFDHMNQQNVHTSSAAGSGPEMVICAKCRAKVATGQKYCNNCGNEMF